jgi:hypothetical protein
MEQIIIDGEVVQTTKIDLATFIAAKQFELQEYQASIEGMTNRANAIIEELQALITPEE